ncbi:hypothetical protein [Pseudomonas xanthosomatis]|uniref:hypothetical protein n=1 Tax=Pseudomonas xanthosomatis TaxID=2842356 RepID=UPI00351451EB
MDVRQKEQVADLLKMSSEQAAEWLISTYPISEQGYGEGMVLIPHRSWKGNDQLKLARHYMQKIPFASERGYKVFSSFMSVSSFLGCIREQLPLAQQKQELLLYHLVPVLVAMAKNDKDVDMIKAFLAGLNVVHV